MFEFKYNILGSKFRKIDFLCISIIIIWVIVLTVFVNDVKAYNSYCSINFEFNGLLNSGVVQHYNSDVILDFPNNGRAVFFCSPEFISYYANKDDSDDNITPNYVLIGKNTRLMESVGWGINNNYFNSYISENNVVFPSGTTIVTTLGKRVINYSDGSQSIFEFSPNQEIEYVDNLEDLVKFLNGDDSVIKKSENPFDNNVEDDSLPVPQELGTDIQNDSLGTPPFISGVWKNPSSLLASYDAQEINIDIQYKPTYMYYKKVFNLKIGKYSSSDYIDVYNGSLGSLNRWIRYNAESGYPSGTNETNVSNMVNDIDLVAAENNISSYSPRSTQIDNGTRWRIRYRIGNKTSLWVVFNINSVGSPTSKETISFENASGDSVSPGNVNYNNSSQTSNSNNLSLSNFFDNLSANIQNIVSSVSSLFDNTDNNTGGFFGFFKELFNKFPQFYAFLILGLLLAILLRILGR